MTFKVFIIAACVVFAEASDPDVLSKRDNAAVEVDPYAAYYEQYANSVAETQQPVLPFANYVSEKQGFAGAMEGALGPDAALVLGTVGAIMGSLAAVGVVLSTQNVNSICTTAKEVGNTALTLTSTSNVAAATLATSYSTQQTILNTALTSIRTQFNAIENKLNGYKTPSC